VTAVGPGARGVIAFLDTAMHLRHLLVLDCKLMRQLEVSFLHDDGSPRLWTVFVGENGTCKTTLLRAIALTAVGSAFANHLVNDPNAYIDRRRDAYRVSLPSRPALDSRAHCTIDASILCSRHRKRPPRSRRWQR